MENLKSKIDGFGFKGVLAIALVFAMIAAILFVELLGVRANYAEMSIAFLPAEAVYTKEEACATLEVDTLLLYSSEEKASVNALEQFEVILTDMKVGTRYVDLSREAAPALDGFSTVIPLLGDLSPMGDGLIALCNWVRDEGGSVYFPLTIESNAYSYAIENKLGIEDCYGYSLLESIYVDADFMIGGGRSFEVADAYDSARTVQLDPQRTRVHARIGDEKGIPIIWEADYGEGKFVVNNFGMCDKAYRGFFAASLSLVTEVFAYPVINASAFYLDDFPSQIPDGNSTYISRDFGTSIRDFYINIWWPDMMNFSDKYGIKYTGLAIESYDDKVDGSTDSQTDTGTFLNFGNMLLRKGGELGYHGYNHQPLCLSNSDYRGIYDYKTWDSEAAMREAFSHLVELCDSLFPDVEMSIYVPPSNLLSEEGRGMLLREFPEINTLSGIYLPDDVLDFCLLQEFEVSKDGIVDEPRVISGCALDEFMTMAALSELNMHYINSHFTHPDDVLDPERGAELGWTELKRRFDGYLTWLYDSAKGIRNMTGSEFSAAIERFSAVSPRTSVGDGEMVMEIGNFYDSAEFMVRFNEGEPSGITGGTLTHVTGGLYLLSATESTVRVTFR